MDRGQKCLERGRRAGSLGDSTVEGRGAANGFCAKRMAQVPKAGGWNGWTGPLGRRCRNGTPTHCFGSPTHCLGGGSWFEVREQAPAAGGGPRPPPKGGLLSG